MPGSENSINAKLSQLGKDMTHCGQNAAISINFISCPAKAGQL